MAESQKIAKKVAENRKREINSAENRKKICVGNRKMTFVSHGKPKKKKWTFETGVQLKQCDISSHINLWGHHRIPEINICIFALL